MTLKLNLPNLRLLGFNDSEHIPFTKKYKVRCHSCEVVVINGVPCHETGCSEAKHECEGCYEIIPVRQRWCENCA